VKRRSSKPARVLAQDRAISQEELVAFLSDRRSYPDRPKSVRLLQTHASYVFMTSRYVYKVKKPVNLGFLDFSTLRKRHHFCEREVLLNRRLSSHVHLGVLSIFQRGGQLAFDGGERVVEYVIQMRRLDDRYFFPMLLKRNEVGRPELNRVVSRLKKFYEAQSPSAEITRWGRLEKLKISTNENFRQTEPFVGNTISRPTFEAIRYYTTKFYQGNAGLFAERMRQRCIRDCHGDLRLEHIHLSPKRLAIYDCIEFNDRLRYLDWANDIAFLAMDLDYNSRPDLSRYFTRRMAAALGDEGLLKVVDFYKCYRAYVRGKVETFQSLGMPRAGLKERSAINAQRYFRLALQYAVSGSEPIVLVVMGRIASGKSTLARSLGRELAWNVFSSDLLRKTLAGVPSTKRVVETRRKQKLYGRAMTNKTYAALLRKALVHVRKRSSVILDATFGNRRYRDRLRTRLSDAGATFLFIEAQASDSIVKRRLKARDGSAGEMSDARLEDFQTLSDAYEPPSELSARELLTARTGTASVEVTTAKILKALAARAALRSRNAQWRP
jgi:uncharacterized protein